MVQTFDFGPVASGSVTQFRLWAPDVAAVMLRINGDAPRLMNRDGEGWHRCDIDAVSPGARYAFVLPDGLEVPDPASRYQPDDVHGASELVDLSSFAWTSEGWTGRPWEEIVLYELHMGTFTPEGTFASAIDRLDHLKALGITAIQIMPLADFPGDYGWGYDGVLPYAPDSSYGRPEDLMALIDAAHARGICVFLDVVYNHFGPDGNYLPAYAPIFSKRHDNPWGKGLNYDEEGSRQVREFVIQNALYWITQFKVDGLRLDAVHAIVDDSAEHVLHELARRVRDASGGRMVHLVVENEDNDSDLLARDDTGRPKHFTAQWNDDIHHVLHIAATGETFGYYKDYADDPEKIGRALAQGFVFQGEHMPYRGETRGKPSTHLPPTAFISFIQNHDQIGNRALGDRMQSNASPDAIKAIAAICLLGPQIPMLFMGEEWGSADSFAYFCDFDEDLNEKVRKGRREELSRLPGFDADDLPDPTARETFRSSKLDWSRLNDVGSQETLAFYKELLAIRHAHIVPMLADIAPEKTRYSVEDGIIDVEWQTHSGQRLHLTANLSDAAKPSLGSERIKPLFVLGTVAEAEIGPWSVVCTAGGRTL